MRSLKLACLEQEFQCLLFDQVMLFSMKVRIPTGCAPKKAAMQQTTEALVENVKRAHLQACVWKHVLDPEPPNIEPTEYGWVKQANNKTLVSVILHVPSTTVVAPT